MSTNMLKPNAIAVQTDVINLLERVDKIIDRTISTANEFDEKYRTAKITLNSERHKVEKLELVASIVAPMKAGKSTIINAIIGKEILPSRAAAMTTIPTQIFLNNAISNPVLILPEGFRSVFRQTITEISKKIKKEGLLNVKSKSARYPHLSHLLDTITEKQWQHLLSAKIEGDEYIRETLMALNDIARLASILELTHNPLKMLDAVPRVEVPFWMDQHNTSSDVLKNMGSLVIVDTPGPNEAGNLGLFDIVVTQLKKSSIVLLVLDFTQLNTKAAVDVRIEVERVIGLRGSENLYILVNKIDERKNGDMTPDQVKEFIRTEFNIGTSSEKEQVFEVAALWAFSATRFLMEFKEYPDRKLTEMQTIEAVAREAIGIRWQEKLKTARKEELKADAEYMFANSGFSIFLENAIQELMMEVAPRVMKSSLMYCRNQLSELREDINIRARGIDKDASDLQRQIDALLNDLKDLERSRTSLPKVEQTKKLLTRKIQTMLQDAQGASQVNLMAYFGKEQYDRASWHGKLALKAGDIFLKPLGLEGDPKEVFEFNDALAAQRFAANASEFAVHRANMLLDELQSLARAQINTTVEDLRVSVERHTRSIIDKARGRLNEFFNLELLPPQIAIDMNAIEPLNPDIQSTKRQEIIGYKTVAKLQSVWYKPWTWIWPEEVKVKEAQVGTKQVYIVSLSEQAALNNRIIKGRFDELEKSINEYIDLELDEHISDFFDRLNRYLTNYKDSIIQSQKDQDLEIGEKKKLVRNLKSISKEVGLCIQETERCLNLVDNLK